MVLPCLLGTLCVCVCVCVCVCWHSLAVGATGFEAKEQQFNGKSGLGDVKGNFLTAQGDESRTRECVNGSHYSLSDVKYIGK